LHLQGRYQEAVERLEEAVARYADDAQAVEARYLIADSYRQLAGQIQSKLDSIVVDSARIAQARETHRLLEAAIAQYDQAVGALQSHAERGGQGELPPAEATILRNCHFMKGAALFDMGKYEEAIRAYSSATNRYQQEPEVLDAYLKIADCYRRLNRPAEARGTIEQAKVVLNRIPNNVSFTGKTSFDRKEWSRHLEWLGGL
jgi:TolA-binding protein